ncbi:CBO0543 family protein [Neobacillus mesonae]|uniref:CBO0543 family protein n=1 Tax=Neobacillus mesonae TaxID=1193713 RepID=UPI0025741851|nr:CBO0543 family protein [Neobacillus mesonae]
MNIAKHLNDSKSQLWRKKQLTFWSKKYIPGALLAALLGTYLDIILVGVGVYEFPLRPFPQLFPVNILFTLVVLPLCVMAILHYTSQVNKWGRRGILLFVSLLVPILEKLAEELGFFVHTDSWQHIYSFVGYLLFLSIIDAYHHRLEKRRGK